VDTLNRGVVVVRRSSLHLSFRVVWSCFDTRYTIDTFSEYLVDTINETIKIVFYPTKANTLQSEPLRLVDTSFIPRV
jgi:hypothetical protein